MEAVTAAGQALAVLAAELDRIEAMNGSPERSAAIKEVANRLQELSGRAAGIRRDEMLRVWKAEELSLGKAAGRVGISKGRADQYVREDRKRQETGDGHGIHDGTG